MDTSNADEYFNPRTHGDIHVAIVGCGAVGSWAGLALAKSGIASIGLYDFDRVEHHNIQNQAFNSNQCGMRKVDALSDLIIQSVGTECQIVKGKVEKRKDFRIPSGKKFMVMLCVDTTKARRNIMTILSRMPMCIGAVEAQMGVGAYEVNLIFPRMGIPKGWLDHMDALDASEPDEVSGCGAPFATSHMGMMTGGHMQAKLMESLRPNAWVWQRTTHDVRGGILNEPTNFEEYDV